MLPKQAARQIISEVFDVVKDWRSLARRLGITKSEQAQFADVFERQSGLYDAS